MKKISVIMPCYNAKDTLNLSLTSLENQTIGIESLEIILIDDASTDDGKTLNILKKFEQRYPDNVVVISLEQNVRQGGARNTALQYATGKYVAYCDADDWYVLNAFEQLYNLAEQYEAEVVEFECKRVSDTSEVNVHRNIVDDPVVTQITSVDERKTFFMGYTTLTCWNKLYRTEFLKDNKILFSEKIFNEEPPFTFMCRIKENKHVQTKTELYYYYQNINSSTKRNTYESLLPDVRKAYEDFLFYARSDRTFYYTYREEIEFIFWTGYFLLPIIYKSKDICTFYTRKELLSITDFIKSNISKISNNKYFKEKFPDAPIIGDLAFYDLSQIDLLEIKEAFKMIDFEG